MTRGALTPWLVGVLLTVSACTVHDGNPVTSDQTSSETDRLNAWFETKFEEQLQFSPLTLTSLGRKEKYDEFDDLSEAAEDRQLAWSAAATAELEREFDYERLSPEARLSYDLWVYEHASSVASAEFRDHSYVFDQMNGAQSFIPTFLINFHRVDTDADMTAYIARLGGGARGLEQLLQRAQRYAANGVRPPRFAYDGVIAQSQKVISGAPFDDGPDSAIWSDALINVAEP